MADALLVYGKPVMQKYTPAAAILAGAVQVVGSTPFVAHVDNPPFGTTPILDAIACEGGIYQMVSDGTPVVGQRCFFNATSKKLTLTATANVAFGICVAGPTGDLAGASPTADGDYVFALHQPTGVSPGLVGGKSEATASATATLTAAQLLGGFINSVPVAAITLTLPTAALMVAGARGCKVGDSFDLSIENSSAGANSITLAAGGATLRGGTSIAQNKAAKLRVLITNVTAVSEAYTVHSIIGA